jgi:hypothetical protein
MGKAIELVWPLILISRSDLFMLTNARNLTLADLRQNFGLLPNTTDSYFQDWLNHLPPLAPEEITALDRLATNYEYLTQYKFSKSAPKLFRASVYLS